MESNNTHRMAEFNDQLDDIRMSMYHLLEFDAEDYSQKKGLAKREVLNAINELRIQTENL